MKRIGIVHAAAIVLLVGGCGIAPRTVVDTYRPMIAGWRPMMDGTSFAGWNRLGDANWRWIDGVMVADRGEGYLVTRQEYGDFELRAEFYAEADTNSGVLVRCQDPREITPIHCYEVNIWDARPGQEYSTGAIVGVAPVSPPPKSAGRWNTLHIIAKGDKLTVVMNGVKTAEATHGKLAKGLIALQHARGVKDDLSPIKFRNVRIKAL